ncbi:MAG: hypothetical protein ACD_39C00673G0002 [uncultured bacterium]|nr:MAG: hypothetical protein ACD_39C00673G0002 [uncultured bacterium]
MPEYLQTVRKMLIIKGGAFMGIQNVLIGMAWKNGQYQVAFQRIVPPLQVQDKSFQEIEISPGYLDQFAVLGRTEIAGLLKAPEDLKALADEGRDSSFFLLHRMEL